MAQRGFEQVAEAPQSVRADDAILIIGHQGAQIALVLVDIEMVEPEPGHALAQLSGEIERPQDAGAGRLLGKAVMASWNAFCATIFSAGSVTSRAALARASNCRRQIQRGGPGDRQCIDLLLGRRRQGIGPGCNCDRSQASRPWV